jgi:hypothetical protein
MGDKLKKLFSFFLDLLSFNTPKAIVFNISFIFLTLFLLPTSDLKYLPTKCVFKHIILPILYKGNCPSYGLFSECNCPFCGLTRAMSRLLKFDIKGALEFNILVIPLFIAMISVLILNIIKLVKKKS